VGSGEKAHTSTIRTTSMQGTRYSFDVKKNFEGKNDSMCVSSIFLKTIKRGVDMDRHTH
jgi:hypothetical protein